MFGEYLPDGVYLTRELVNKNSAELLAEGCDPKIVLEGGQFLLNMLVRWEAGKEKIHEHQEKEND